MHVVLGGADGLLWVPVKALLLYLTAVAGLRLSLPRLLSQLSGFDFAAAVAVGAIVGRVPSASDAGYLQGFATLLAVLAGHRLVTTLRARPGWRRLAGPDPVVVVLDGQLLPQHLRRCGLTRADILSAVRRHGVDDLGRVRLAVQEPGGTVSVVLSPVPLGPSHAEDA